MPLTVSELVQKAKAAIGDGDLEKAETYKNQATALKALELLDEPAPVDTSAADAMKATITELQAFKARIEAEPATNKAGHLIVTDDETDKELRERPYKSLGDFLMAVKSNGQGNFDKRLAALRSGDAADEGGFNLTKAVGASVVGSMTGAAQKRANQKAITGLGTQQGATGGFLVATDENMSILERVYTSGQLLQRIDLTGISAGSNGMTFNVVNETSRANGSRGGGIRGYWMGEGSSYTASTPVFRQIDLRLKKAGALVYATDEMLADASALESYIMRNLPAELRFVVEDSIVNGTGSGQPLGVLNSGATVSISKETNQAATTIVTANVLKMWARRWVGANDYVWLINQDIGPQLHQLSLGVGTGGQLTYMPPGGLSGLPYATLLGRPVLEVEYAQTLGTVGDIMLVSLNEFQAIDKGGIESASSMHVNFTTGENVYRFTYRFDGQSKWNAALTPKNGSNSVSPFVTLATRS